MAITILLADDHQMMRDGLRTLLSKEKDIEVVGEAENGREAVSRTEKLGPRIVVMDVGMPDMNGIEATRQIHTRQPEVKVVALSMHADRRFVIGMFQAGASGYLLKDSAFEELAQAIRTVAVGHMYLSPAISDIVIQDYLAQTTDRPAVIAPELSPREREVLQLLAEGESTRTMADHLHVSHKTIETHRMQIMTKLDLHSIAELTKYAIREGLTSL